MKSFHNTTDLTGSSLDFARAKAETQDKKILDFMKSERKAFSPDEVWMKSGLQDKNVPLTSVRRAMSNLTRKCKHCGGDLNNVQDRLCCMQDEGILTKLKEKRAGIYGSPVNVWIYTDFIEKI